MAKLTHGFSTALPLQKTLKCGMSTSLHSWRVLPAPTPPCRPLPVQALFGVAYWPQVSRYNVCRVLAIHAKCSPVTFSHSMSLLIPAPRPHLGLLVRSSTH